MRYSTQEIAGIRAIELWELKRDSYFTSGEYPFLIGDSEDLARLEVVANFELRTPSEIIACSQDFDLSHWMTKRRAEEERYHFDADKVLGTWPDHQASPKFLSVHRDTQTRQVKPRVKLGLARIGEPWHLPAVLRFGNWNDCPDAVVHCALLRSWQSQFGAEIAGASSNTLECIVSRPPQDREAALALAWEQFWYCDGIVHQRCRTISNLAASLIDSNYWYFWWD